jgi:hypothetical protein
MATKSTGLETILPYKLPALSQLVYVKTNVAGYFFDAFVDIQHSSTLKITSHPVQSGANITDHAYLEPAELTMKVKMSDCMQGLVKGQFTGAYSRSVSAYRILKELQANRIPFQVVTRLQVYQNMLIESLSIPDGNDLLYGLEASLTLKQILVVNVKTIKTSARVNATGTTPKGTVSSVSFGNFQALQKNGTTKKK